MVVSSAADINSLPRQLSPKMLGVLLEDLVEYNGISYRTVPLRTFRGKYIGLYFGSVGDARCEQFLEQLRGFYIVMNHKFECVLVSSDGTDRDYERHTQLTMWPTYPRGDYRPALLRNHFEIKEVPVLIILDSHGVVVTSNAVSKVDDDHAGFPWAEKVIDRMYGDSTDQGRLLKVLETLELPTVNNIPALQHQVVGLIFGELWCPDARELMNSLDFLLQHLRGRFTADGRRMDSSQLAIYLVHQEEIRKYSSFLNFKVPFPTLHISDEDQVANIHHYLGVTEQPMFCLVSPKEGWIVKDGVAWVKRDPTGVCFPWQPRNTMAGASNISSLASSGYVNILQQLTEDELNRALCHGPVFVALLHNVHRERREAIATLRASALAYAHRVSDRTRIMRRSAVDMMGTLKMQESNNMLEVLRRELSRPSSPFMGGKPGLSPESRVPSMPSSRTPSFKNLFHGGPRGGKLDTQGKVLWRVLQSAVEKHSSLHGSAPWNASAGQGNTAAQNGLSFFYATEEDRTTQVLSKFCCCEVRQLQQHQAWRRAQAQLEAKEMHQRTEMMQQFDQVTADASQAFSLPANILAVAASAATGAKAEKSNGPLSRGASFQGPEATPEEVSAVPVSPKARCETPASIRPESRMTNATYVTSESGGQDVQSEDFDNTLLSDPDDIPVKKEETEEKVKHTAYLPKTNYAEWNEHTQTLLGDNHAFNGTGLIIDVSRGCYYICGSLTNKETILKFLDAWDQGTLDSFEIRMPNDDEHVKDDEADMEREMSIYSQQVSGILPEMGQNVIPGIVIWIPTLEHSESHMGPEHLYRALLNLAFQRCPREDKVNAYRIVGSSGDPDDEDAAPNKSTYKRLTPWIEKLWIFGLLDTDEAKADKDAGTFDPPSSSFLLELHTYVDELLKTMSVERREDVEDMLNTDESSARSRAAKTKARRRFRISPATEDMLIPHSDLFDEGLCELRRHKCTGSTGDEVLVKEPQADASSAVGLPSIGNYNLCMRTARTRRELHAAMLDELAYHSLVQYLPPPLFVLFVGDLPPAWALPWPTVMSVTHLHVLGNVPSLSAYREISPALNEVSWASWAEGSADDRISPTTARHIAVPWA
mmetsp:Transcript_48405/g.87599  ORF Transcript_48405/g.87599 Transcript_48405/m.87599 type:complete len:1103 (-) Transcript_48405:169-3477(-)